jgi:hypothetical protein
MGRVSSKKGDHFFKTAGRSWFDELVYAPAFAAAAHLLEKQCNFARGMGSHAAHDEPVRALGV